VTHRRDGKPVDPGTIAGAAYWPRRVPVEVAARARTAQVEPAPAGPGWGHLPSAAGCSALPPKKRLQQGALGVNRWGRPVPPCSSQTTPAHTTNQMHFRPGVCLKSDRRGTRNRHSILAAVPVLVMSSFTARASEGEKWLSIYNYKHTMGPKEVSRITEAYERAYGSCASRIATIPDGNDREEDHQGRADGYQRPRTDFGPTDQGTGNPVNGRLSWRPCHISWWKEMVRLEGIS
jgi:hypothetical protein